MDNQVTEINFTIGWISTIKRYTQQTLTDIRGLPNPDGREGGRNRAGLWAEMGSKISCLGGGASRQEKHLVFENKEAGLYMERTNNCNYFRMADV